MECSKAAIHRKTHRIPEIKFEDQQLAGCFRHLTVSPIFGHCIVVLLLFVHLLLGYRRLQDMRYYQDDPMVRRLLGLERLPDVATVSRTLASLDDGSFTNLRQLTGNECWNRWVIWGLPRVRRTPHISSSFMSGRFPEYPISLSHACSTSSPTPYSRFSVRYVHGFCLMLPSDTLLWQCPCLVGVVLQSGNGGP